MKIISFFYNLPILPFVLAYQFYVTYRLVRDNDDLKLDDIDTEEKLWAEVKPHVEQMYETYKYPFHVFCILFWITFFRFIC
jgi:hypothetical protein